MDQRILEFIGDLRRAEMRISPSEALDALAASAEIGLDDRETFKSALATTLVKESRDLPTFDRLFDLYFLDLQALGAGLKKALGPEDPRIQEMLERLMAEDGLDLDELTELMLRGQGTDMEMAIRQGGEGAGLGRLRYFFSISAIFATRAACLPPANGVASQVRRTSSAWVWVRRRAPSVSTLESLCSRLFRAEALS